MATFVADLPANARPQLNAGPRPSPASGTDPKFGALLAAGLSLFAFAINGYHPYAEDGGLYIAGVKKLLDPSLYPHQTGFVLEPTRFSLFAPFLAGIVRFSHAGLPATLLVLQLAGIWGTIFAAWMLAARCWQTRTARSGAVALLACWLALPIAGTALMLMDPYVTARSFSTPCMVIALVGMLDLTSSMATHTSRRKGFALWICSLSLAAAMHPLMAAYALAATLVLACIRSTHRTVRTVGTAALCLAALPCAACLQSNAPPESATYIRVALTRTYWFPAQWHWYELAGLAAPLAILTVIGWRTQLRLAHQSAVRSLAQTAVTTGITALAVALLFARTTTATHLLARLQPLRVFQIVYLIMILTLGALLGEALLQARPWRWAAAAILLGGITFTAARQVFPSSAHLELPSIPSQNSWVQAFLWIRGNTPKDALFALDADYINLSGEDAQCFRAIAERSALPDYSKDGGEASIAPTLADAWQNGQRAQQRLSLPSQDDSARIATLAPLGVTWAVMQSGAHTALECPFANRSVKVCRLR